MPPSGPQIQQQEIVVSGKTAFNMGFFGGLGSGIAFMIFTLIGLLFFIPGLIIIIKQHKKPKEQRNKTALVFGYVLMFLGLVVAGGIGIGVFAGSLGDDL